MTISNIRQVYDHVLTSLIWWHLWLQLVKHVVIETEHSLGLEPSETINLPSRANINFILTLYEIIL